MKKSSKKNHYVDNKLLTETLSAYIKEKETNQNLSLNKFKGGEYIGQCILDICYNLANKTNFIGYTFKEEMIEDAIENCVKAAINFKPEISTNAFGYFTQVAFHAFVRRIKIEARHREKFLRVLSDDEQISELMDQHFDGNTDTPVDSRQFIESIHSLLAENNQLIEFVQPTIKQKEKQRIISVFDDFLG